MKNSMYLKIRKFAIEQSSNNNSFSNFIVPLYNILAGDYVDMIITIIGTIIIGVMLSYHYLGVGFWIVVILYCFLLFFSSIAHKYCKEKVLEAKVLKQALIGTSEVLRAWSVCLQKSAKKIISSKKSKDEIKTIVRDADFQSAAFTVCEKLHANLTKYCDNDDIYKCISKI